ncbi:MAG: hypothetical protein ACLTCV_04800 [Oscillospiraceae bacterium]|nr:MAG: Putative excisionase [Bacteriophage sp.]
MSRTATLTAAEAVERLRAAGMKISSDTLREGLLQRVFPFGSAVRMKETICWIYPRDLEDWIEEHLMA